MAVYSWQSVNRGVIAGDGTGESAFSAFGKMNSNWNIISNAMSIDSETYLISPKKILDLSSFGAYFGGASSNNLLDDYEEGLFSPVLEFGGASTGIVYDTQLGRYTKIGKLVTVRIEIILTNKGTATGIASVSGLPFVNGAVDASLDFYLATITFADYPMCTLGSGQTEVNLQEVTNAGSRSNLSNNDFSNTSVVQLTGTYST